MNRHRLHRRSARAVRAGIASLCLAWFAASSARADVPSLLPIQGYVTDKGGKALDGKYDITFRLYSAATGDTPFHSETIEVVVLQGHFNAYLGDDSGIPLDLSDLRDHERVFLGLEVEKDGEGVPRLQLAATAFAAQSAYCSDATNLGGKAPSEYAATGHAHSWSDILDPPAVYAPAPHAHDSADIMCYADLLDEGHLDNDDPNDLLTQSQGDDRFASKSHSHDAGDIQNGTLSADRYSAYDDLNDEGYLNADKNESLITRAQGDGRWGKRPLGSASGNQMVPGASGTYIFPAQVTNTSVDGSCVVTVVARAFASSSPPANATFYTLPAVESDGSQSTFGAFGYAMPGTNNGYHTTTAVSGQIDFHANKTYKLGCYVYVTNVNLSPFVNASFSCITTWVCN